jgi:hypothetical protein
MGTPRRERELFRLEPSLMAIFDQSTLRNASVQIHLTPWRGAALGLALSLIAVAVLLPLTTNLAVLLPCLLALAAIPIALEVPYRRDFLTETAVVRQRGFFGTSRTVFPLAEIERVE